MAVTPLLTTSDLTARYASLLSRAGISDSNAIADIARGAVGAIKRELGYDPQLDAATGLPQIKETLDGGRPVVFLAAPVDTSSTGYVLSVKEMGATLTPRLSWPAPGTPVTGDYILGRGKYTLIRLAGSGAKVQGMWGVSTSSISILGQAGDGTLGGPRQGGDYTDTYRGVVEITYTPDIDLSLIKQVALSLARLDLLATIADSAISDADQSLTSNMPTDLVAARQEILARLQRPIFIGTGR